MAEKKTYIALLRGINVGGHHKVPMADLRKMMEQIGFGNVKTLLNSGNVIFDAKPTEESSLESTIGEKLESEFGFPVPIMIRTADNMATLIESDPFAGIEVTKDIRLYVSFLKEEPTAQIDIPWVADDGSYRILKVANRMICSVLDLSGSKTTKAMDNLEKIYGKNITTRNWNTLVKIVNKVD